MKRQTDNSDGSERKDPEIDFSNSGAVLRGEVYRPPEYLAYLERVAGALKTVRIIVYAGMTGFIVLAFYGFFLIYQLTGDVRRAVDQTVLMTQQMQAMALTMANMHDKITDISGDMTGMRRSITTMDATMTGLAGTVGQMGSAVALMQHSTSNLDQSIGPMMGAVNSFVPFGMSGNDYPGAPPYAPVPEPASR
ncbi:hypothetical protein [Rhodobacter ferrooxidans]|uniref:hypothetical protein n=1 Tax=Rhodobacter ferrooxidans TaxID=371731 RepID=UPI0012EA07EB|nr:hypothetical protein [Rhodobacter sp. SW2]